MRRIVMAYMAALAVLLVLGLVLVSSASSGVRTGQPHYFLIRQALSMAMSLVLAWVVSRIDYRIWARGYIVIPLALALVAASAAVFFFDKVNGSHRWINLGFYQVQPSEFAKVGVVLALAAWFEHIGARSGSFMGGFFVPLAIGGVMLAPILLAPDFGSTIVILAVVGTICVAAGARFKFIIPGILAAFAGLGGLIYHDPHRLGRMMDYWNSLVTGGGERAYQTREAIYAFVQGGPFGAGLNNSLQKASYLPEAHTDCIYAIAGEELGLVASAGIVVLFAVLLILGTLIALRARDRFGRMAGLGITILICFEAGFNMGMVLGCLPTKGLALPFLSYGGSSLMASLVAVGLLLSIARQNLLAEHQGVRGRSVKTLHSI